jgi:histidine ammonia-lyase
VLDTIEFCTGIVETELNSCNDNPLIFETVEETFYGGNFHGQYVAMASDYLAVALTEIGVLAERQLDRLLDPHRNGSLPSFLVLGDSGLGAGLMGAQYLATSIASENLDLATPSSVKSLPSNGDNQDVVSMGFNAARRCLRLCDNVERILTVLAAACFQAASIIGLDRFSPASSTWLRHVARSGPPFGDDEEVNAFLSRVATGLLDPTGAAILASSVGLSTQLA